MTEEWRPVIGHESSYEVSDLGRVRSLRTGVVLSVWHDKKGYPRVTLAPDANNAKKRTALIHRLVLPAFLGPKPDPKSVTRHLDGNPKNNGLVNLRWGTYSENNLDRVAHGTDPNASRTACIRGHAFDEANTYRRPDGRRKCRACARIYRGVAA